MKILIIVPSTRVQCQGLSAGAYASRLLESGHQILLLYHMDRIEPVGMEARGSCESAPLCWEGNHLAKRLKKRIAIFDADLVHVWDSWNYVLAAALECSLINNAKLILHMEDDMLYLKEKKGIGACHVEGFELVYEGVNERQGLLALLEKRGLGRDAFSDYSLMKYDYDPLLFWLAVRRCDGFTAIWYPLKSKLEQSFGKPVELLPPGYDEMEPPQKPQRAIARQKCCGMLCDRDNRMILLGHGGSIRHLDDEFSIFLKAVRRAYDEDSRIRLVIWGYDADPNRTEQLIEQHNLKAICHRYGPVSDKQYWLLQAAVDIHCCPGIDSSFNRYRLPSRLCRLFHDGASILIYGVGFGESLIDGEQAVLTYTNDAVEWARQILKLTQNLELRIHIGAGAAAFAAKYFDMTTNANRLVKFYEQIISDTRRAGPFTRLVDRLKRMGVQTVALYGAGLHTQRMLAQGWLDDFEVVVVFDDFLRDVHIGLPIASLSMHGYYVFDVLVVSSDTYEQQMIDKACSMNIHPVVAIHMAEKTFTKP